MKILIALGLALLPALALASPAAPTAAEPLEFTGRLRGWSLDMDGTVFLKVLELESASEDRSREPRTLWFKTPPDKSIRMAVEDNTMALALGLDPVTDIITVRADAPRGRKGDRRDDAFQMPSITKE